MNRKTPPGLVAAFLGPAITLYALFVLVPAVNAFRYSLTRWDGLSAPHSVGGANFAAIFKGRSLFITALGHNLYLMTSSGIVIIVLSLAFAWALHRRVAGARLYRIAFFFPNVLSFVAVSLLWMFIYSTTSAGILNNLLRVCFSSGTVPGVFASFLGTHTLPVPFTESSRLLTAIPAMMVWSATGFYLILFLAAMENIPETLYEAARLDGAGDAHVFFRLTLPLMWDVLTVGVVYMVIGGLKVFDSVWIMENGRPARETHTLGTLMYSSVFEEYNIGLGSAIAVCLFALIVIATVASLRLMKRERLEY